MWGVGAEPIDQRSHDLLGSTRLLQYNRRQLPVLRVARSKDRLDLRDRVALRCQGGATIIDLASQTRSERIGRVAQIHQFSPARSQQF